jgi:hypothetical protein
VSATPDEIAVVGGLILAGIAKSGTITATVAAVFAILAFRKQSREVGIRNSAFGHCAFSIRGTRGANRYKKNIRHLTTHLSHDQL